MAVPTSWADEADVLRLTGRVVTADDVAQATAVIELTSGGRLAKLDAALVSERNFDWLKRAVAYQAAWMASRPDYFEAMDVSQMTQDGVSATIKADGLILAPLARRCLKRLSWRGVRTIRPTATIIGPHGFPVGTATVLGYASPVGYGAGVPDDELPWRSMS